MLACISREAPVARDVFIPHSFSCSNGSVLGSFRYGLIPVTDLAELVAGTGRDAQPSRSSSEVLNSTTLKQIRATIRPWMGKRNRQRQTPAESGATNLHKEIMTNYNGTMRTPCRGPAKLRGRALTMHGNN